MRSFNRGVPVKIKIKKAELKYGLKVPKRLYTYDDATLALIVNGCGPRGFGDKIVPDKILFLSVKMACIIHDFMYESGTTPAHKTKADDWFLDNMLAIIKHDSGFFLLRVLRERLAFGYYQVVSEFGEKCFKSKTLLT